MRLPFKVEPKPKLISVGTEETGILEIPRLGDLTVLERIFIQENTQQDANTAILKLAKAIASATSQPTFRIYRAITDGDLEVIGEYLEEFREVRKQTNLITSEQQIVRATTIIKYRLAPEWTLEDSRNPDLISPGLLKAVAEFGLNEENGWVEPEPITEEAFEGKYEPVMLPQ